MAKPYPQDVRDGVVAVARQGRAPLNQIAKDFGISAGCLLTTGVGRPMASAWSLA